ncbi:hypothetical protein GCM10007924_12780 [Sneathiella chinensis]|uniref:Uncharacterized protein n=1 Tax=Sneathiella chinensis TaxID=349750 RepID=A0ABQ5U405_9PROT|nr:hypothetical protein GCM10007924_12780 [Sneathiella chinensis]
MPCYKVKCYEGGLWDKAAPRNIEALNEQKAAESICGGGEPLVEGGKIGQLRAEVWLPASPNKKKYFYVRG